MSNINWSTHTVSNNTSENNNDNNSSDTQTRRVLHTAGHTSFSGSTSPTLSGDSDQSFTERGQILSRHHRRVTLSPSPEDEGGQEFGWGTTLVSTLHHQDDGDRGDNNNQSQAENDNDDNNAIEWRHFHTRPLNVTKRVNEITTLRYNDADVDNYDDDHASRERPVELSPPARHPHRPLSDDRRSTWGRTRGGATSMVVTTTTTTNTTTTGGNGRSDRTIRYEPDVLRWHEAELAPSTVSQGPLMTQSRASQQSAPHQSHNNITGTRNITTLAENTSKGRGSIDDDNMIEEVVRTIHASRTGPFPGLSHGHGNDDSSSGSSYDEELLLSGQGLRRNSSRIPRLNVNPNNPLAINNNRSQQTSTTTDRATHRQSHETNRDTFGSRQMSFGQQSITNAGGESSHKSPSVEHVEQQQQRTRPASHLLRPIVTDGGVTSHGVQTNTTTTNNKNNNSNNNNRQDTHQGERAVRRTSITRIPGANLVDVTRRGSDGKTLDNRRLSMSRNNSQNCDRATELGGGCQGGSFASSASNNNNRQEAQNQSNGLQQSTSSSMADNTANQDPRKTHVGAAARYAGLSKTGGAAAHGNATMTGANQDFGETAQSSMEGDTSNQQTTTGGRGATGILAAAHAASVENNRNHHLALHNSDPNTVTSLRDFAVANTATTTSSGDNKALKKTNTSNTQVRPAAGSTSSSSPNSLLAQHHHDNDKTTTAGVPPASMHHGQHAIFTNLPEPEKAHYHQNRGLGYRFREASLSTVGSVFKPEQRRQSSVTVMGDDAEPRPTDDERYRDEAWNFLRRYRTERIVDIGRQPSYLRRLRWRIDLHLMVFLFFAYLVTFLDKILLNYARVMGILTELDFTTNDFANASSYFYVASLAFSLPYVWLLAKVPLAKLLAVDLVGWGICTATHAALRNYGGLVALRVLSGVFEAGILPCLILLTGQYFTWREQPIRFAYWTSGIAVGQMLSGLLSWAFQHMSPRDHLSSWKTLYLLLGDLTIVLGFLIFFFVPDTPMKARFLNNEEKVSLLEHVKVNQTGISNRRFHPKQIVEGILDLGCWLLGIMVVLQLISAGVTMFYSVTMLNGFGYSTERSALLNMPSGAINLVCIFLYAILVRYWSMRWVVVCFAGILSTVGAALLFGLTSYGNNRHALLAGLYLINFAPGATMIVVYWLSCNVAGHTKRAYAAAAMNAAYALGAIIGPQTFRHQAVPGYRSAKMTLVITMAVTVVLAPLTAGYFWYMNRKRDRKYGGSRVQEGDLDAATAYAGLTDKQNKMVRYRL